MALLLMLTVSLCFLHKKLTSDVPAAIFSYAITILGRISRSLRGIIDQDALLACLFHRNRMRYSCTQLEFNKDELLPLAIEGTLPDNRKHGEQTSGSLSPICCDESMLGVSLKSNPTEPFQRKMSSCEELRHSVMLILERVAETWPLIQSGHVTEVKRALRSGSISSSAWKLYSVLYLCTKLTFILFCDTKK